MRGEIAGLAAVLTIDVVEEMIKCCEGRRSLGGQETNEAGNTIEWRIPDRRGSRDGLPRSNMEVETTVGPWL